MILDSNVLIEVIQQPGSPLNDWLYAHLANTLRINPIIFAELSSSFARCEQLQGYLASLSIAIEPLTLEECHRAGFAYAQYRQRGGKRTTILPQVPHRRPGGGKGLDARHSRPQGFRKLLSRPHHHRPAERLCMSSYRIQGATGEWEVVIGLEVHAQIVSRSKLFSGAATAFGAEPNSQVSLVDAAMPGMLPVPNRECIRQAVRTGMAIQAQINRWSRFDRKNYFYADLPQGYQISQLYHPLVGEGSLTIEADEKAGIPEDKVIGIERIHVEQDAGKLMHDQHPTMSYVDLNRSGVALMEIVSRPDMRSPAEAGAYVRKLRSILRYVGSCDGNMEEGSMRADVNVSVRRPGADFGTRTETKNVNSVRFVMQAIEHEARRQVELIEDGGSVVQETRLFDPNTGSTRSMRSKEDAHDYRYFPDPDLLPLELDEDFLSECRASLPELPDAKRRRYVEVLGLSDYNARELTAEVETFARFETLLAETARGIGKLEKDVATQVANWALSVAPGVMKSLGGEANPAHATASAQAAILDMQAKGEISGGQAKEIFEIVLKTGRAPAEIAETEGLKQQSDTGAIEAVIDEVLAANQDKVSEYRGGKDKLFGFFVGQTMKAMQGKGNPAVVNQLLKVKLAG